jgi:hypothetical protein
MPHMPLFQICVIFLEYAVWLYSGMSAVTAMYVAVYGQHSVAIGDFWRPSLTLPWPLYFICMAHSRQIKLKNMLHIGF